MSDRQRDRDGYSRRQVLAAGAAAGAALALGEAGAQAGPGGMAVVRRTGFEGEGPKAICSPATVFMTANTRDGNWGSGYRAERDLLLEHIRARVSGSAIFLTGDTHLTGVHAADGRFEARAAPIGIPTPNDITLVDPLAAARLRGEPGIAYADDRCHFTLLEIRGGELDLSLVREDGARPYERRFR